MDDDTWRDAATDGGGRENDEKGGESGGADDGSDSAGNENGDGGTSASGGNGDGGAERPGAEADGEGDGSGTDGPTWIQTAVVLLSVVFALTLFAYAGWQIVESPRADVPEAAAVDAETVPDGRVAVTVVLRNPTGVGLVSATVEARCADPPPSVALSYVPADSTRRATLVCPPGTSEPEVAVVDWVSR